MKKPMVSKSLPTSLCQREGEIVPLRKRGNERLSDNWTILFKKSCHKKGLII
jgi:hypothetical protein